MLDRNPGHAAIIPVACLLAQCYGDGGRFLDQCLAAEWKRGLRAWAGQGRSAPSGCLGREATRA
jgi:hypothetical protein